MSSICDIAGSALQAFSKSQQITAYNISNLNTDGFKASKTAFQENGGGGGGVANNATLVALLEKELKVPIQVPPIPSIVGALGAALHGSRSKQQE